MQLKSQENVYFINSLSPEEELDIINSPLSNSQPSTISKTFGNYLKLPKEKSLKKIDLKFGDLKYFESNELSFYLCLMLLSSPPFYNFIVQAFENSKETPPLLKSFYKIILALKKKESVLVESFIPFKGIKDVVEGYRFILESLHNQLLSYFYFSRDSFTTPNSKPIFRSFSPISSLFHGETKEGYFDVLKGKIPPALYYPSIFLLETNCIPQGVPEGYIVSGILSMEGETIVLYVLNYGRWTKYTREGIKETDMECINETMKECIKETSKECTKETMKEGINETMKETDMECIKFVLLSRTL